MSSRANHQRFPVLSTKPGDARGRSMEAEIKHDIAPIDDFQQIVPQINLSDHLELRVFRGASKNCLTHAAFCARNDDLDHYRRLWIPHRFIVWRKISRFFGEIGTSGSRNSSSIRPIIASAAFTGPGLVSINRSLNKG